MDRRRLNKYILRKAIKHEALNRFGFLNLDREPRFQILHNEGSVFVCNIDSVIRPNDCSSAVHDLECDACQRLIFSAFHIFVNYQRTERLVKESQSVPCCGRNFLGLRTR